MTLAEVKPFVPIPKAKDSPLMPGFSELEPEVQELVRKPQLIFVGANGRKLGIAQVKRVTIPSQWEDGLPASDYYLHMALLWFEAGSWHQAFKDPPIVRFSSTEARGTVQEWADAHGIVNLLAAPLLGTPKNAVDGERAAIATLHDEPVLAWIYRIQNGVRQTVSFDVVASTNAFDLFKKGSDEYLDEIIDIKTNSYGFVQKKIG